MMGEERWEITASVPADLTYELRDDLFTRIADAVNSWVEQRGQWDAQVVAGLRR